MQWNEPGRRMAASPWTSGVVLVCASPLAFSEFLSSSPLTTMNDHCVPAWDITYRLDGATMSDVGEPIYCYLPGQGPEPSQLHSSQTVIYKNLSESGAYCDGSSLQEVCEQFITFEKQRLKSG